MFGNFGQFQHFWQLWFLLIIKTKLRIFAKEILGTWNHDNLCDLTIKSDTGQHSQCLYNQTQNQSTWKTKIRICIAFAWISHSICSGWRCLLVLGSSVPRIKISGWVCLLFQPTDLVLPGSPCELMIEEFNSNDHFNQENCYFMGALLQPALLFWPKIDRVTSTGRRQNQQILTTHIHKSVYLWGKHMKKETSFKALWMKLWQIESISCTKFPVISRAPIIPKELDSVCLYISFTFLFQNRCASKLLYSSSHICDTFLNIMIK